MPLQELLQKTDIRSIGSLREGETVNLIGYIIDYKPVNKSKSGLRDYCRNVVIKDGLGQSIPINLFKNIAEHLPLAIDKGNILVIKKLNIVNYRNLLQGNSTHQTTFTTFTKKNDLKEIRTTNVYCPISNDELLIVNEIFNLLNKQEHTSNSVTKTCDILFASGTFKYVGMVVGQFKVVPYKLDLQLVDFTKNPNPYPGHSHQVYPNHRIQCTLWDNHASNCPPLSIGDFVCIVNVHKKLVNNVLTMNVHRSYPKDCFVRKLNESDELLQDLLIRKKAFEDSHGRQNEGSVSAVPKQIQSLSKQSTAEQRPYQEVETSQSVAKVKPDIGIRSYNNRVEPNTQIQTTVQTVQREAQTEPKDQTQLTAQNVQMEVQPMAQNIQIETQTKVQSIQREAQSVPSDLRDQTVELRIPKYTAVCSEVRNLGTRCSLSEILEKELAGLEPNASYMTRATVRDYKPKLIQDWVQQWCNTCFKTYKPQPNTKCENCGDNMNYIFQFVFLIEDEDLNSLAYGFRENSSNLFGNITPKDVYNNPFKRKELEVMMRLICKKSLDIGLRAYTTFEGMLSFSIVNTKYTASNE